MFNYVSVRRCVHLHARALGSSEEGVGCLELGAVTCPVWAHLQSRAFPSLINHPSSPRTFNVSRETLSYKET